MEDGRDGAAAGPGQTGPGTGPGTGLGLGRGRAGVGVDRQGWRASREDKPGDVAWRRREAGKQQLIEVAAVAVAVDGGGRRSSRHDRVR